MPHLLTTLILLSVLQAQTDENLIFENGANRIEINKHLEALHDVLDFETDHPGIAHLTNHQKMTKVFYKNGTYTIYTFYKPMENEPSKKVKKESRLKKYRSQFHESGNDVRFVHTEIGYQRHQLEETFLDPDFVMTAENLKQSRLNEIENSKMNKNELDALKKAIEHTHYEQKARHLSYLINIVRDHKKRGTIINK